LKAVFTYQGFSKAAKVKHWHSTCPKSYGISSGFARIKASPAPINSDGNIIRKFSKKLGHVWHSENNVELQIDVRSAHLAVLLNSGDSLKFSYYVVSLCFQLLTPSTSTFCSAQKETTIYYTFLCCDVIENVVEINIFALHR